MSRRREPGGRGGTIGFVGLSTAAALLGGCTVVPEHQTTDVDVARQQALTADPWFAPDGFEPARTQLGSNGVLEDGRGTAVRTAAGAPTDVVRGELTAAQDVGWAISAAACEVDGPSLEVELVRAMPDGALATVRLQVGLGAGGVREVVREGRATPSSSPAPQVSRTFGTGDVLGLRCLADDGPDVIGDPMATP